MTSGNVSEWCAELMDNLSARWRGVARDVLLPGFELLSHGRPVPVAALASQTGADPAEVQKVLGNAPVALDNQGRIVNIFGFGLNPSRHRIEFDGVALFACCAVWAHFIPRLAGRSARVESVDPVTNRLVRLTITPERVVTVEPTTAAGTLVQTDRDRLLNLTADIGPHVCCHINHFESPATADEFVHADPHRFRVDIDTLNRIAHELSERVWL